MGLPGLLVLCLVWHRPNPSPLGALLRTRRGDRRQGDSFCLLHAKGSTHQPLSLHPFWHDPYHLCAVELHHNICANASCSAADHQRGRHASLDTWSQHWYYMYCFSRSHCEEKKNAIQIALCHLWFNIFGILI